MVVFTVNRGFDPRTCHLRLQRPSKEPTESGHSPLVCGKPSRGRSRPWVRRMAGDLSAVPHDGFKPGAVLGPARRIMREGRKPDFLCTSALTLASTRKRTFRQDHVAGR